MKKTLAELKALLGDLQTKREEIKAKQEADPKPGKDEAALLQAEYLAALKDQEGILNEIEVLAREEKIDGIFNKSSDRPDIAVVGPAAEQEKYSLGEYMQDVFKLGTNRVPSKRFENKQAQFKAAASGLNEALPADGSFLVGADMAAGLIKTEYESSIFASKCRRTPISSGSNALHMNGIAESSRVDGSRRGGILGYWEDEADLIPATKPKFAPLDLKLKKVTAAYYATDEILQDVAALESQVSLNVAEELAFKIDDAIVRGDGAGRPLGITKAQCLVTVAKINGQPADTIIWENIRDMFAAIHSSSRSKAAWYVSDEGLAQLMDMVKPVGTSGVAVWLPANQAVNQPYDMLLGRPVFYPEQMSALGDLGDIVLADMSQYQIIEKGGIQGASSIHFRFLNNEQTFRFVQRIDGQPLWANKVTPYKGAISKSPFVTLAERA